MFRRLLQIVADLCSFSTDSGDPRVLAAADLHRKPQQTADFRRKSWQKPVSPTRFLHFGALLCREIAESLRTNLSAVDTPTAVVVSASCGQVGSQHRIPKPPYPWLSGCTPLFWVSLCSGTNLS